MNFTYRRGKTIVVLQSPEFEPVVSLLHDVLGPIARRKFALDVEYSRPQIYDFIPARDVGPVTDLSYLEEAGSVEVRLSARQVTRVSQGVARLLETGFTRDETDYLRILEVLALRIPTPV